MNALTAKERAFLKSIANKFVGKVVESGEGITVTLNGKSASIPRVPQLVSKSTRNIF